MKETKLKFSTDDRLSGYDYYPFFEIFKSIDYLKKIDLKDKKRKRGINYTILIQCTTLIEGMTSQIINSSIENKEYYLETELNTKEKNLYLRILNDPEEKINNSFFREFSKIWKIVYDQDIKIELKKKDEKLWENIKVLFDIKNAITHGHKLTIEYKPIKNDNTYRVKALSKYSEIYNFLSRNDLIEADTLGMVQIVNDEITDFFIIETQKFINSILLAIPSEPEKSMAISKYQLIQERTL